MKDIEYLLTRFGGAPRRPSGGALPLPASQSYTPVCRQLVSQFHFPRFHNIVTFHHSRLVEGVGAGSPPGQEHGQADGLEGLGSGADGDALDGALLGEQLGQVLACWLVNGRHT